MSELEFFARNPGIEVLEAFVVEANGVPRGKWIPRQSAGKIFKEGMRLPCSICAVDVWGEDVLAAGLVTKTGDPDGICLPVPGSLKPVPWLERPTAQILMTMHKPDGTPFYGDPRHVLQSVVARLEKKGLRAVVATELEFYLFGGGAEKQKFPQPPFCYRTGRRHNSNQLYSISEMQEFEPVLTDIARACALQDVPADTAISENGPGQFEMNLNHVGDAMLAADHAVLLKRIVKGVAHRHKLDATFMAKPYVDQSGNGLHVHVSLADERGHNVFAGKGKEGSDLLRYAIGGVLATMRESTAVFAANANSYRRLQKGSHAPTAVVWGYDNRAAAVRIPAGDESATRLEHRVAGADANPYLVLALVLGGMLHGIENKIDPGAPAEGNAYDTPAESLPDTWSEALALFESSPFVYSYFGGEYQKLYAACKRQEKDRLDSLISDIEYDAYLRSI